MGIFTLLFGGTSEESNRYCSDEMMLETLERCLRWFGVERAVLREMFVLIGAHFVYFVFGCVDCCCLRRRSKKRRAGEEEVVLNGVNAWSQQ